MNKGEPVVVIKSPYKSVKRGTITIIKECYGHRFGTKCNMYVLEGIPMKYFREHEIALITAEEYKKHTGKIIPGGENDENIPISS